VSTPPRNSKRPGASRPSLEAPADPFASLDESPAPGAASVSVRPPAPAPKKPVSRVLRALELTLGVIVVMVASVAVAYGARRYILTSPRFAVRSIVVDGPQRRTAQQVARAGGLEVGKNIFSLDLAAAGAMITQDPWIERATVTRKLPSSIHVAVVEREATALVAIGGDLYLATRAGDLFKRVAPEDPFDLPLVTGILPDQVVRDRPGVVLTVKRVLDVAEDLERSGVAKRYPVQELHLERDGSLVVFVGKEAISLHLGHAPFRDKVEQAQRVLTEVSRRKANASVVFLDNEAHPERVVVRMR
jgi:cell division protein FtsQ